MLGQYIIMALVFNKGKPHRSELYTNFSLLSVLLAQAVFLLYSLFSDDWFNREVCGIMWNGGRGQEGPWTLLNCPSESACAGPGSGRLRRCCHNEF